MPANTAAQKKRHASVRGAAERTARERRAEKKKRRTHVRVKSERVAKESEKS